MKPDWKSWRFDQIAINVNDRVEPGDVDVDYYVGLEHLDSDSLKIRRWGVPSDVDATKLLFKKGDIIFGRRRVYQRKLGIAEFGGICSAHAMVLRPKEDVVLPEFLPFFMQRDLFMNRALEISVGSLSPTINWRTLAKQEFALPPLEEQRRIVAILLTMNETKEANAHAIRKIELLRDSVIKQRAADLSDLGYQPIRNIVSKIEAGKSPRGRAESAKKGECGVLKVSAVGNWDFLPEENKVIEEKDFREHLEVKNGDFLATRANADPGSVGRTCIVENPSLGLMLSDKTWRIVFESTNLYDKFGILAWTKSPPFRIHVRRYLGGTEAKNISQKRFLAGPFPDCTPEQFNAFSDEVIMIQKQVAALRLRLNQINTLIKQFIDGMTVD